MRRRGLPKPLPGSQAGFSKKVLTGGMRTIPALQRGEGPCQVSALTAWMGDAPADVAGSALIAADPKLPELTARRLPHIAGSRISGYSSRDGTTTEGSLDPRSRASATAKPLTRVASGRS